MQPERRAALRADLPREIVGRLPGGADDEHLGRRPQALHERAGRLQALLDRSRLDDADPAIVRHADRASVGPLATVPLPGHAMDLSTLMDW